jgi:hypothetical protein
MNTEKDQWVNMVTAVSWLFIGMAAIYLILPQTAMQDVAGVVYLCLVLYVHWRFVTHDRRDSQLER